MSKTITSLSGFVKILNQINSDPQKTTFFRGHSDRAFEITPAVFRSKNLSRNEAKLLSHFQSEVPKLLASELNTIDRLVIAQHYGVPTRLLDFTLNPLMALFFACKGHPNANGRVIAIALKSDSIKFPNSDTISCLANLSFLTQNEKTDIEAFGNQLLRLTGEFRGADQELLAEIMNAQNNWEKSLKDFNDAPAVRRLVQFIRNEKPYFENRIHEKDLLFPVPLLAKKNNARILAQSGCFLVFGTLAKLEQTQFEGRMEIVDVGRGSKKKILSELSSVGIDDYAAFPEPEKIAIAIKRKYS